MTPVAIHSTQFQTQNYHQSNSKNSTLYKTKEGEKKKSYFITKQADNKFGG